MGPPIRPTISLFAGQGTSTFVVIGLYDEPVEASGSD